MSVGLCKRQRCRRPWSLGRAAELLHDASKAAKQARYAGESVAIVIGKDAGTFAAAMEAVQ